MSSRKEYEMLFQLSAQLGTDFNKTFQSAQKVLQEAQKQISSLNKTQSDISAFQKQKSAVETTRNKLENLQKQYDLLQKEIDETTGSTDNLEREKLKLEQKISDTSASLERQNQKLRDTDAALKEAGIDTNNLSSESAKLGSQIDELKGKQEKAAEEAQNFGDTSAEAFGAISNAITTAGIAKALKEIYDAYVACVSAAGDFEEGMSNVEALSGATADEMAMLTAEAKELGATTKFTAQESADAMGYMAMAGWDATEMLSGMDGVLQLAAASGEDLAMVSDIVTDNLSAFGLAAADTAHFSDVLAAAATNANTNVSIMGETFKMSASVAGALGYSIEDVAVAVGLMANSGVKGSVAGTALRNTFNGLLEGVTLTGAAFGEYEYSAVKADGTMKSFRSTIDELRGYFDQMTEAERVNNAMTIAGQRGYNGLLAILNATDEDYASLTESINNCSGAAAKMAAIKLDNLNGELTLMKSAWDALKTTIGEQFIPEMRTLYRVGTDVFGAADDSVQKSPQLVKAGMAVVGVLTSAAGGIMAVNTALKVFKALNVASMFTSTAGIAVMAVAGIAALTAACYELASGANEAVDAWNDMIDAHETATQEYQESIDSIDKETASTVGLVNQLRELSEKNEKTAADKAQIVSLCDQLNSAIPELALSYDAESDSLVGLTGSLDDYISSLYEAQKSEKNIARMTELYGDIEETKAALAEAEKQLEDCKAYYDSLAESGGDLWAAQNNLDTYSAKVAELNELLESEQAEYQDLYDEYNDYVEAQEAAAESTENLSSVIDGTIEKISSLTAAYNEAYGAALESIQGQYDLWDEAASVAATSAASINSALESQISYWQDYNANLQSLTARSADIEGLSEVIATFADGSAESVNAIAGLATASDEELTEMVANWRQLQSEQKNAAGSVADLKTDFTATMDELQAELAADIEAMDLGEEAAESGMATIQGFIDGATDMLPQVRAAYAGVAAAAKSALYPSGTSGSSIPGYAVGTQSAAPGFAMVGEHGPELVYFNGGEKVMTAAETAAMRDSMSFQAVAFVPQLFEAMSAMRGVDRQSTQALSAASDSKAPVSIQITFDIDGNVTPETVDSLRAYGDDFADRVLEVLNDAGVDAARRRY